MVLDALGKWSLLDTYILIMMMVGFKLDLASSSLKHTMLNVYVEPGAAFYVFMLATMVSLIMSHIILACHRYAQPVQALSDNEKKTVSRRLFGTFLDAPGVCATLVGCVGPCVVPFILFACIALLSVGSILDSFQFGIEGAIKVVLLYLNESTTTSYSLLSLGSQFPFCTATPDEFGVRFTQIFFYIFAFGVPLIHICVLILLWVLPLQSKTQYNLYYLTEILNAWSTIDVLAFAILISTFEVKKLVEYILAGTHKCDLINVLLSRYFVDSLGGYPQCVDLVVSVNVEFWIVFVACLLYFFVGNVVMRVIHKALDKQPVSTVVSYVN